MPSNDRSTEPSGGGGSADTAAEEAPTTAGAQDEQINAELRRQFRELLLRQPDDRGLVLRASRSLPKPKDEPNMDLAERMRATLESLGDQLLPPDG
jgi:hypothetical protein